MIDDQHIDTPDLQVPHPQMRRRAFVLHPLLEIAPHCHLPDGTVLGSFLSQVAEQTLSPLAELDRDALIERKDPH